MNIACLNIFCSVAITSPVGAKNNIAYLHQLNAPVPLTQSWYTDVLVASGAKIGIDNTANPEDDGTIKPKQKKINSNTMINNGPLIC